MAPTSQQNGSRMSGSCLLLQRGIKPSRVLCSLWLVQALLLQEMMLLGSPSGAGKQGGKVWAFLGDCTALGSWSSSTVYPVSPRNCWLSL